MATNSAAIVAAMIERVAPGDPEKLMYDTNGFFTKYIKIDPKIAVSGYNFRSPLELFEGGTFGGVNQDGGEWLEGTGSLLTSLQSAVKETQLVGAITDRAKNQTATSEQAVVKWFATQLAQQAASFNDYIDISWHQDGTGQITAGAASTATVNGVTTYTFNRAVDFIGLNRVRDGQCVSVFASNGSTPRGTTGNTSPIRITKIDRASGTVTLDRLLDTTGIGDTLSFVGITSQTTFNNYASSTPPVLSPDSWVHGMYYFNNANPANYIDGRLRGDIPQLMATTLNAANAPYTSLMLMNLVHMAQNNRGDSITDGWIASIGKAQVYNLQEEAQQVSIINNETVRDKYDDRVSKDMVPRKKGVQPKIVATLCEIDHVQDSRQYDDRVDFLDPRIFGEVNNFGGIRPLRNGEGGQTVWRKRGSNGNPMYQFEFGWEKTWNWYTKNPGAGGYITDLGISSTYKVA